MRIIVKCSYCSENISILSSRYKKSKTKNFYCDIHCKSLWQKGKKPSKKTIEKMKISNSGENNGNYKDGHTFKESYCECGNKKDWRANKCNNCYIPQTFKNKHHSYESKLKIGIKSREKFTKEFKNNFRKKMEKNGLWVPNIEISDYNFYFKISNWIDYMFDLQIEGKELIAKNGIFNGINNCHGVVRDHKLSRRSGYELRIFPEILRHPCNCEILKNSDNISKGRNNSITLENLFEKIIDYDKQWIEQELCIYLINVYKKGFRYKRSDYE